MDQTQQRLQVLRLEPFKWTSEVTYESSPSKVPANLSIGSVMATNHFVAFNQGTVQTYQQEENFSTVPT